MKQGIAELLERIERGEDLETISLSLISVAEKELLKCCSVVRTFNEGLVDNYFRQLIPGADEKSVPFRQLTQHSFVQRVPRTDDEFCLTPEAQKQYYDAWWETPSGDETREAEVPKALCELSTRLLEYYEKIGPDGELDLLAQQVYVSKAEALQLFESLYKTADEAFDLARCRDIINVLNGRENVLGASFAKTVNDKDRYLQSRSLWATEYYQTVSYYEREELRAELKSSLGDNSQLTVSGKWILHLHAPGGMGKTMFVRWLVSRRCVPEPYRIPCARVDFDFVDRITTTQHHWQLFLKLARNLDVQIPGFFLGLIKKFTEYELILNHAQAQQATSSVPADLPPPEVLDEEILFHFSKALKDAELSKPVILIFDTLEEVILYHPEDLMELVRQVQTLRKVVPNILLVLSGRYDLTESDSNLPPRVPEFGNEFGKVTRIIRVKPFAREEALGFLQEKKGLPKERPLEAVVERADGNPFKLALFADILIDDPEITAETIRNYPSADLLYLIERVLMRLPNKKLHWLLRYGVVPRKLTLPFVKEVMKKHLLLAMTSDAAQDDPIRYESLSKKVQETVKQREILPKNIISSPLDDLNVDDLWTELQNYASSYAWVTMEGTDPNTVTFHGDVVNPMRRWLEQEPIYRLLHQDAIAYFENKAQVDSAEWAKWMRNAVYHKFQLHGAVTESYWTQLMFSKEALGDPRRRRELALEVIGLEYVDDDLKPRLLCNGEEIIKISTLVLANYHLAHTSVEIARAENAIGNHQLWADADYALQKCQELQKIISEEVVPPSLIASLRASIFTSRGNVEAAIGMLEAALAMRPSDDERLELEMELVNAFVALKRLEEATIHCEIALKLAERVKGNSKIVFELHKQFARIYWNMRNLQGSALHYQVALHLVPLDDRKTKDELLIELSRVYFDTGQFSRAAEMTTQLFHDGEFSTRLDRLWYWNFSLKVLIVSADPLKALEVNRAAELDTDQLEDVSPSSDESRSTSYQLSVIRRELLASVWGELLQTDDAFAAWDDARSQWRELGDVRSANRCLLKKVSLWLRSIGDVNQARHLLEEAQRFTGEDPDQWLEQELLRLRILRMAGGEGKRAFIREPTEPEAWGSSLRAKMMLGIGVWTLLPNNKEASNKFFAELTAVLEKIEPPGARMLLLEPLSEYPACKKIEPEVAENFIKLFPHDKKDEDFIIHGPKVAEALRVIGKKEEAMNLLKELAHEVPDDKLMRLRELSLVRARTSRSKGWSAELSRFAARFLKEFESYPLLCGSTLIELAELSFTTRSAATIEPLLETAEQFLNLKGANSQWMARLLLLRARLSLSREPEKAMEESAGSIGRAINLYRGLGTSIPPEVLNALRPKSTSQPKKATSFSAATKKSVRTEEQTEAAAVSTEQYLGQHELVGPPSSLRRVTTAVHVQTKLSGALPIKMAGPGLSMTFRSVEAKEVPLLKELISFNSSENYSFGLLKYISTNWLKTCWELGQILIGKEESHRFLPSDKDKQPAVLRLIIDDLQLSAPPWELLVLPSQSGAPASIAPALSYLYRSAGEDSSTFRANIIWLQHALKELGNPKLFVDGAYGKQTETAVRQFQSQHELPDDGVFDGATRRKIKSVLQAEARQKGPRVLLLRPSVQRQRAGSRGHQIWGLSPEKRYRAESFGEVLVIEDPERKKLEEVLLSFQPDVLHISSTMEESPSIGIYLDFLVGGGSPTKGGEKSSLSYKGSGSAMGRKVEFLTLTALTEMMKRQQMPNRLRPQLVLDVLEPPGQTDLFTQLLLRNAFAAQLYKQGGFETIIATGLTPANLQEELSGRLISGLGSGEAVGDIVNRLRRVGDVGDYRRLPDYQGQPGPLRNPSDRTYLSTVVATAATALFTQDPTS